jgi:hypothetical protein
MRLTSKSITVPSTGSLIIALTCAGSPCTGSLTLKATVKRKHGKPPHVHIKTSKTAIATASFSQLPVGNDTLKITLNTLGKDLLREHPTLKLSATLTFGSGQTATMSLTLHGRPQPAPAAPRRLVLQPRSNIPSSEAPLDEASTRVQARPLGTGLGLRAQHHISRSVVR